MIRWVTLSPFPLSLPVFPNHPVFLSRAYLRQSSFLFLFVPHPLLLILPSNSQESLHVSDRSERPAGSPPSGSLSFGREPPFVRFTVCPIAILVLPPLFLAISYFLFRRIFTGVFPLSSRKKFFYNFRIVLFRSSPFFQPRASRSPQVGFTPPSSVALPTAAHVHLCFLLSRFHFVQPFLCFPHGLSLIPVAP